MSGLEQSLTMTGAMIPTVGTATDLPENRSVLAVCAHPDDESFGLGAALARFSGRGSAVSVLCFTHGEASTLGDTADRHLAAVRLAELASAAEVLGVSAVSSLSHPDGALADQPLEALAAEVTAAAQRAGADLVLVLDERGVTGHPDHVAATGAGLLAAGPLGVPVLAWALEKAVADELNLALGTSFVGRDAGELDICVSVDRQKQLRASRATKARPRATSCSGDAWPHRGTAKCSAGCVGRADPGRTPRPEWSQNRRDCHGKWAGRPRRATWADEVLASGVGWCVGRVCLAARRRHGGRGLPRRLKELIALAIAVAKECDGCIVSHAKGAAVHGATPEQVAEALSVALLMNGGPATVYGPRAWAAYQEFATTAAAQGSQTA